jgi:polysaccharide deacetylase family protein (PEP-CTERM system associated)
VNPENWYRFDSRLQKNIEDTLDLLDEHSTRATFFVLGWIGEQHPDLVRRISERGHEVASRGHLHQPLLKLDRTARMEDLSRSRAVLEDVTGHEVSGFRLSDGWLSGKDLGFLDDVFEAGYRYDSSLMPKHRDFGGEPFRRGVHVQKTQGGSLLEIPLSTASVAGAWLPISGGNYLRQLPQSLMRGAVDRWVKSESTPYVMYFQVWELDEEQPRVSAVSRLSQVRHYRNLGIYRRLLPEYLNTWKFTSIREHSLLKGSPLAELAVPHRYSLRYQATPGSTSGNGERGGRKMAAGSLITVAAAKKATIPSDQSSRSNSGSFATGSSVGPRNESERSAAVEHRRFLPEPTPVTLVIPCYNEEGSLPYLARTLEHLKSELSAAYELNVLFVDDCSRDNTREVLETLFGNEPGITIVGHEVNRGVSAAILTGLQAAKTEIVCSIDCDCSYDPHELKRMLPLMKPGVAMVTASPYHRDGNVRNVPGWRLTLSHGLSVMYRLLLRKKLSTWTSCFRVYRKSQILDLPLNETGFLGTAELAAQLCLHDRVIVEHPAVLEVRLFGASKMKTLRTIRSHLRLLARMATQRLTRRGGPSPMN